MAGRLDGKVAVITGGGNGIGRATALRFLAEGAAVVIADLNRAAAEETLELARQAGHQRIHFVPTDVTREAEVAAAIDAAPQRFGRLDCVFNNAGIAGAFGPITHLDADEWDFTFAVLVRAVMFGLKHGARVMKAQNQGGSFINTASVAGLSGGDGPQAYSASKAAVINLSRAVAIELAPAR
ncbi:MAG: SDR family NAD(P)-dependent oxidoreductase, partial [Deltaproteobacteria bacterium]|nr:SDR family NAD(P)-dependent oxidoreductase [Deltaproteobacteria bacterium]